MFGKKSIRTWPPATSPPVAMAMEMNTASVAKRVPNRATARARSGAYTRSMNRLSFAPAHAETPRPPWPPAERMMARWDGRMSLLSTSENAKQRITTQPMAPANAAVRPVWNSIGRKAMMVVSTPKVAGTATRRAPRTMLASV